MTGRQKMQEAFSKEGTAQFPAVLCYEGLYIRDHWDRLTPCPWWYKDEADIDRQIQWRSDVIPKIGQDWFALPVGYTKKDRENLSIVEKPDGFYRVDKNSQKEYKLHKPHTGESFQAWSNPNAPQSIEEFDERYTERTWGDPIEILTDGRKDLADKLLSGLCADKCPSGYVSSPLQACVSVWGFENFMLMLHDEPELIKHASERFSSYYDYYVKQAKYLGAESIWIEECYLDMISPEMFREFNMPLITRMVDSIRETGMKSVYYHTGDPFPKLDQILAVGADAVSFEESKKNFKIDIEEIVDAVQGRCTVFGNLDATSFLEDCTYDELKSEIKRQIAAGRKNKGRFIMSMGSPVTPGTPVEKVKLYCDLVHEYGNN